MRLNTIVILAILLSSPVIARSEEELLGVAGMYASLGDTHSHHFWFIPEYLQKNPSTRKEVAQVRKYEIKAGKAMDKSPQKPPSASIGETSFSNIIGTIVIGSRLLGGAVYDRNGLRQGFGGIQVEPVVVSVNKKFAKRLQKEDYGIMKKLGCAEMKKLLNMCTQALFRSSTSCSFFQERLAKCATEPIYTIHRAIFKDPGERTGYVGYSVVVFDQTYLPSSP